MTDHPDSHELDDWFLYGPKNPKIAQLVSLVAQEKGMRVAEIEAFLESALQSLLGSVDPEPTSSEGDLLERSGDTPLCSR